MKLLFTLMMACASLTIIAQPKNCKKIIISNELSAEDNFMRVGRLLIYNGFEVDSNKDFLTIRTRDRQIKGLPAYSYYHVVFKDQSIQITGKVKIPVEYDGYTEVENKGLKGSAMRKSFEDMLATAQLIGTISEFQ